MAGTFIGDPWKLPYTAQQIQDVITNGVPVVGDNGNWWRWDINTSAWVDTGVTAATSLADDSVITSKLADGSVTTPKLADGAVTWPKLAPEVRKANDNLLDNAYFIGGGSQQGGGQFPINQRGLTEYTGAGYGIDRWINISSDTVSTLDVDGLVISGTSNVWAGIQQWIDNFTLLRGKTVTFSALLKGIQTKQYALRARVVNNAAKFTKPFIATGDWQLESYTFVVDEDAAKLGVILQSGYGTDIGNPLKVAAAKLELGPIQTLAYQDTDGNWILNGPPPKFGAELAECQRYYSDQIINAWIPLVNDSTGLHQLTVKYPVTMRAVPATKLLTPDGAVVTSVTVATKDKDYAVLSANANATVYRIINNADL